MKKEEFEIIIGPDGNFTVEGKGYTGDACLKDSEWIKDMALVVSQKRKPEFYKTKIKKEIRMKS